MKQLQDMNKRLNAKMLKIDSYEIVFNKIHKYGIAVLGAFIYGLETDTPETMKARTKYINNAAIDAKIKGSKNRLFNLGVLMVIGL